MSNMETSIAAGKASGKTAGIVVGLLIFLVPFFTFLSPLNLKQLNTQVVFEIILSLAVVSLILFFTSSIINKYIGKFLGKKISGTFPILCFVFYLQFLYRPTSTYLHDEFSSIADIPFLVFGSFELLCLMFIVIGLKFSQFFIRLIFIFSVLMLTSAFVPIASYVYGSYTEQSATDDQSATHAPPPSSDAVKVVKQEARNVYFVILDGMMSIETASEAGLVDAEETLSRIEKSDLKYIPQSISSYSGTYLTLASIVNVDHHQLPDSPRYKDRTPFYPAIMHRLRASVPLVKYVKQAQGRYYWVGTYWGQCSETSHWTCVGNDWLTARKSFQFYVPTPLITIYKKVYSRSNEDQYSINKFMRVFKDELPENQPFFAFIHHLSPHPPYLVTEDCKATDYGEDNAEGYKASYRCALNKVEEFMDRINATDPKAVVVFLADHGWDELGIELNKEERVLYRAKVFNAIKAPDSCFEKFGEPKTTVNSVRFALNCAYGYRLPYRKDVHYKGFYEEETEYGTVLEKRIY